MSLDDSYKCSVFASWLRKECMLVSIHGFEAHSNSSITKREKYFFGWPKGKTYLCVHVLIDNESVREQGSL